MNVFAQSTPTEKLQRFLKGFTSSWSADSASSRNTARLAREAFVMTVTADHVGLKPADQTAACNTLAHGYLHRSHRTTISPNEQFVLKMMKETMTELSQHAGLGTKTRAMFAKTLESVAKLPQPLIEGSAKWHKENYGKRPPKKKK